MSTPRFTLVVLACLLGSVTLALAAKEAKEPPTTKKAASRTVRMNDKKYDPATITIKAGETVVWKNEDDHDHTVNADDKSFKSGNLSPGDKFEFTFKKAGTIKYACKYHPRMKGSVVVEK